MAVAAMVSVAMVADVRAVERGAEVRVVAAGEQGMSAEPLVGMRAEAVRAVRAAAMAVRTAAVAAAATSPSHHLSSHRQRWCW